MVIKMLIELDRRVDELSENFNIEIDDIINLKKLESKNTEPKKNGTENRKKNNPISRQRAKAHRHRRQRGFSRFRKNIEKGNDTKPYQEPSGFKPGQSSLNKQPVNKQEKCNENSKSQAEKSGSQAEGNQHQLEGSQGQSSENRHHSERSHGQLESSCSQSESSHGQSESSRGQSERSRGQSERSRGQSESSSGQLERSPGQSERSRGQSARSPDQSERSRGQSESSSSQSESLVASPRVLVASPRVLVASPRVLIAGRKVLVVGRRDPVAGRRDPEMSPENDSSLRKNDRRHERYVKHGVKALLLTSKKTTTKSSLQQPRGKYLKLNFQAAGNQTKLLLSERFSKLKAKKIQESLVVSSEDQKALPS
ncbi:LOW QUALITY PROTEIN: leucine zipper protein 4 [Phoca vitulina]|uniref:LOW QUALITY PROTEIN: leucine zipper protein 4 n=1 Tax=Phoca vitulina TaxID=9720 RepID=UPI001395DE4D|nr:LOW QUALITY PROTEIN: leucine zipper protein 4 [Phoca vitulina]